MKQAKGKELILRDGIDWHFPTLSAILYGLMVVVALVLLDQHNRPVKALPKPHFTLKDVPAQGADGSNEHGEDGIPPVKIAVDSESLDGTVRMRYHNGRAIAMQPNPTWFWIVLDSLAWKQSKWKDEKPRYPKGAHLIMTKLE